MKSRCVIHVFQNKITFSYTYHCLTNISFNTKRREYYLSSMHDIHTYNVPCCGQYHHCQWYLGPEFKCLWYKKLFKWGYPFSASFLFTSRHTGDFYLYILNSFQVTLLYSKYWVSGKWLELRTSTNKSWKDHPRVNKETTNFD